ncbi:MAG: MFS transporter [Synechococcus sp.]|nr:MFS transporter [Synechococcus sp.]
MKVSGGLLIATMCCALVLSMTAFSTFVTLLPVLALEFGLNNSQAGLVSGTVLGGYMAGVPFLGPLTDRIDPRRVYFIAALVAAAGALGFAWLAGGFWTAFLCQALIGVGLAGTYIPGMKALTDRLEGPSQSRGAAIYGANFGIGVSVSLVCAGAIADAFGWEAAFVAASAGPLLAAAIILLALEASAPRAGARPALLDFRPVLRNRHVRPYLFTTAAHSWELHGTRSWLVAFLTFAAGARGGIENVPVSVALVTALIFLLGPLASISGNELALRYGRARVLTCGPLLSAAASCIIGFLAASPWIGLLAFAAIHMYFVGIDAGTMTAGVVSAADPAHRGATLAVYSMVGFGTGFMSPTLFGVVLDLAGGRGELVAWGLAFASLGLVSILGTIPARRLLVAEYSTQYRGESGGRRGTQGGESARDRPQGS